MLWSIRTKKEIVMAKKEILTPDRVITENEIKPVRRMLTIAQAANGIDGVSEHFIRKLCVSGQLECVRAGKKILISEDRLNEFMFGIPSVNKKTAAAASTKKCSRKY